MGALDSFCDDCEDIEQIMKYMDAEGPRCGMTIPRDEIIQALGELVRKHGNSMEENLLGNMMECRRRRIAVQSIFRADYPGWPFDDERALRKDWIPPQ